jgi:glycosyltransferase involved in cell wall biosynthesis
MRIVLNLLPLKTGGGVQVASDFIKYLATLDDQHEWHAVARKGMPFLAGGASTVFKSITEVEDTIWHRVAFETLFGRKLSRRLRADVVYTIFGPQWFGVRCPSVVGCAYSNLLYPEVFFWQDLPLRARIIRYGIDWYRKRRLLVADGAIFETDDLAARAVSLLKMEKERVTCVRPKPSSLVVAEECKTMANSTLIGRPDGFYVLVLVGYHPNKRLHLIAESLRTLHEMGHMDIYFIVTLPSSPDVERLFDVARRYGVRDWIINVGQVVPSDCAGLYQVSDAVLVASRLESFSNTISEAWQMEVPLIACDQQWAKQICNRAALYFAFDSASELARQICRLKNDSVLRDQLKHDGREALTAYPDSATRYTQIMAFLEKIVGLR